jgi:hypothetical protein
MKSMDERESRVSSGKDLKVKIKVKLKVPVSLGKKMKGCK